MCCIDGVCQCSSRILVANSISLKLRDLVLAFLDSIKPIAQLLDCCTAQDA